MTHHRTFLSRLQIGAEGLPMPVSPPKTACACLFTKAGQLRHLIPKANHANIQAGLPQRGAEPLNLGALARAVNAGETDRLFIRRFLRCVSISVSR